jgi:multiple sugar transport system substrate-binding protein
VGEDAKKIMTYELRDTAISRPLSAGYVAFEEVMNRVFGDLRNGADVVPTLQDAERELNSTLSRIQ